MEGKLLDKHISIAQIGASLLSGGSRSNIVVSHCNN